MSEAPEVLLLDMLEWLAEAPRTYAQTMEAWRTSCPRLTVWEDAAERDFIRRETAKGVTCVVVTAAGHRYLHAHGRQSPPPRVL
jgi:hypothetical protein